MAAATLHLKVMFVIKADKTSLLKKNTNQMVFVLIIDRVHSYTSTMEWNILKYSCYMSVFKNILTALFLPHHLSSAKKQQ